ncbi:MAG: ribonuclease HII [Rhodospirillales bacterium]|jgi:ribonuclease HII|nr:ribonuclease HII [Rhodospirillales bacterium]MDP6804045.1 ribonuclease HII [Rhodospirillales bacterium]
MPDFRLETAARKDGADVIAGVDEAGRGPWAGPVVAAAVILDAERLWPELASGLDDSKKLARRRRIELFAALGECAEIALGIADVAEIDTRNILVATMEAMRRAVAGLAAAPQIALVDGITRPPLSCDVRCVVKGDARSLSIAAASIAAKVTRDGIMAGLASAYPGYGWERNAGYGTAEHREALERLGPTPHHRRTFAPVARLLND